MVVQRLRISAITIGPIDRIIIILAPSLVTREGGTRDSWKIDPSNCGRLNEKKIGNEKRIEQVIFMTIKFQFSASILHSLTLDQSAPVLDATRR